MLRIFDLLPENEIDNIKKVQVAIKLEKYKLVSLDDDFHKIDSFY